MVWAPPSGQVIPMFQCGDIAYGYFLQQRRTPQSCMYMGWAGVCGGGGNKYVCTLIYIDMYIRIYIDVFTYAFMHKFLHI